MLVLLGWEYLIDYFNWKEIVISASSVSSKSLTGKEIYIFPFQRIATSSDFLCYFGSVMYYSSLILFYNRELL